MGSGDETDKDSARLRAVGASDQPEEAPAEEVRQRRRGVYLLPNLITTGALFAGFYAIVAGATPKATMSDSESYSAPN